MVTYIPLNNKQENKTAMKRQLISIIAAGMLTASCSSNTPSTQSAAVTTDVTTELASIEASLNASEAAVASLQEDLTATATSLLALRRAVDALKIALATQQLPHDAGGVVSPPDATPPSLPDASPQVADASVIDAALSSPPAGVDCTHKGSGTAYNVGPSQPYANLGAVPWDQLGPGDTVLVHYKSGPYREKVFLSNSGTQGQPIRVCGVPGPGGKLPEISGKDAVTPPNQDWTSWLPLQELGTIIISRGGTDKWGYRPEWITIEGLRVTGARAENTFTNSAGSTVNYVNGSAGIYLVPGAHVILRGNEVFDNSMGLFTLSKGEYPGTVNEDIVVESNYFHDNGVVGSDRRHSIYTQTIGVLFQYNHFGSLTPGALGSNLKDRSSGTIVRYNYFDSAARLLALVEAEEHAAPAMADPRYRKTFVYGNIFNVEGSSSHPLLYGGDNQGAEPTYRKGTLYFYNNTVVVNNSRSDVWRTSLWQLATADETAEMVNNVIVNKGDTNFSLIGRRGVMNVGKNVLQGSYTEGYDSDYTGTVTGVENLVVTTDAKVSDTFTLLPGSPAVDAAVPLVSPFLPLEFEYKFKANATPKVVNGTGLDMGALESN